MLSTLPHPHSQGIHQWLRKLHGQEHYPTGSGSPLKTIASGVPIHTISTEVLRCHPRRPGLLSVAGGRNKLSHIDPTIAAGDAAQEAGSIANTPPNTPYQRIR